MAESFSVLSGGLARTRMALIRLRDMAEECLSPSTTVDARCRQVLALVERWLTTHSLNVNPFLPPLACLRRRMRLPLGDGLTCGCGHGCGLTDG
jgi:hypothetical protein